VRTRCRRDHHADEKKPGFFTVSTKGLKYRMHPVESRTGAIRLEDPKCRRHVAPARQQVDADEPEAGLRIADECQTDAQSRSPPK
jgi:hypothetical protein